MKPKPRYIIIDWASNVLFNGQEFESFEDAWGFVYEQLPEEDWEDIYVIESCETREARYLDPNHPAGCTRKVKS